jgi:hypothetical protein
MPRKTTLGYGVFVGFAVVGNGAEASTQRGDQKSSPSQILSIWIFAFKGAHFYCAASLHFVNMETLWKILNG